MKVHRILEKACYCSLMFLLTSLIIGLIVAVWMAIFAGVVR